MADLQPVTQMQLVDPQAQIFVDFLKEMGLPSENIIAAKDQRAIIGQNLPQFLQMLPPEVKQNARYLSKFVVGAGIGLFDYSLNAIWNEVVLDLHRKVIAYGLDIFYDAAVGGKAREFYKTEDDLHSIKDSVLLDNCRKLELIQETTYKKLRHILDMRNDIGISHPTSYTINAFELLGWLQTCIQDVLQDQPTEAALQVQAFIQNLKTYTQPLDPTNLATIAGKIGALASHHTGHVLRTMFGIYVAADTDQQVRKNIALLAVPVWTACTDDMKYKLGLTLEGYNTNLYQEKYKLGQQFFDAVKGNAFRSNAEKAIIVDALLDELLDKHNGWDNFHHEGPVADSIASYIRTSNDILPNFEAKLAKVIMMCRIGRGVSYNSGVSPRGRSYYDKLIALFGDRLAPHALAAFTHVELQMKLAKSSTARDQAIQALQGLKSGVVTARLQECIDFLLANLQANPQCVFDTKFKTLSSGYIKWT